MNRFFRSAFFPLIILVVLAWVAINTLTGDDDKAQKTTYSQLYRDVANGASYTEFVIDPNKQEIVAKQGDDTKIVVHYPSEESLATLEEELRKNRIAYDSKGTGSSPWWGLLTALLPFIILIAFWIFLMNQVQGGGSKVMSFGKSRAKRLTPDSPKIGFKDVAGVDEAVEELHEIKEFLENPKKFQALGARIP
ncbi:MAG: cell division protein FtsH, partial [Thermoleophilia bacterium]|nr:cell division protein FtsH [Thermoleophilia bacterium]